MSFFRHLLNLHDGEEKKEKVIEDIISNISFRGANLWILACAILIASIGLNVNSTAVIIGAMLISPLMGPIVGAGFALATYDFDLLKKTGRSLLIATIVSLLVSFIYFYISPFKDAQSELLARTSPTDCLCRRGGWCYLPYPSGERKPYPWGSHRHRPYASPMYGRLRLGNR